MNQKRIIIDARFSVEHLASNRSGEISGGASYLVVYALSSETKSTSSKTALLVNPHESVAQLSQNSKALMLRIAPQLLIETAAQMQLHCTGAKLLFRQQAINSETDERLIATLSSIHDELMHGADGWREVVGSLVNQLTIYLLRSHVNVQRSEEVELSRVGIVDRRLRRAIEFMHDNCGRELGLNEIAEAAYLSPFHFTRLFKKLTNTTPHAYLASLRIDQAKRLLAETDLPIAEIGARVGYESQSHFTKVFREATSLTPKSFRDASRNS